MHHVLSNFLHHVYGFIRVCVILAMYMVVVTTLFSPFRLHAQAQYVEDALRYTQSSSTFTPRMGALGLSYAGVADDYAALYVNPAGLTLLPLAEFSASWRFLGSSNTGTYLTNRTTQNVASTALGHLGIVLPVRVGDAGNFAFAFGYARGNDFTQVDSVAGFNTNSTFTNAWVQGQRDGNIRANPAWGLNLADTIGGRFFTPLTGNLQQNAIVRETGAINTFSGGVAFDVIKNFSVGVSIVGKIGTYSYFRIFQETDTQNRYNQLDAISFRNVDFRSLSSRDLVEQTISGISFIIGGQGRIGDNVRVGASVTLPGALNITEEANSASIAYFDNNDSSSFNPPNSDPLSFTIYTPWVFNAGASAHIADITVTGSAEYTLYQDMTLSGRLLDVAAVSNAVRQLITAQLRWGIGAEYDIPNLPLVVRASYSSLSSPYQQEAVGSATSLFGVGAGFYTAPNARLDAFYRLTQRTVSNTIYDGAQYRSEQTQHQLAIQYVVRF
jgi:hypothetical protein